MALLVVSVTWILIRAAPGSFYSEERALPPAIEANIREKYGLDKPFYQQYLMMLGNVLKGDFGDSLRYQEQSVNEIIMRHLPYSATIGALAYLLALIIGLTAGIIAALRQNSAFDYGQWPSRC
jgi:oligopeptide transport system permease protein